MYAARCLQALNVTETAHDGGKIIVGLALQFFWEFQVYQVTVKEREKDRK